MIRHLNQRQYCGMALRAPAVNVNCSVPAAIRAPEGTSESSARSFNRRLSCEVASEVPRPAPPASKLIQDHDELPKSDTKLAKRARISPIRSAANDESRTTDVIDLGSDDEDTIVVHSRTTQMSTASPYISSDTSSGNHSLPKLKGYDVRIVDLEMVLWIPNTSDERGTWTSITSLPKEINDALRSSFYNSYISDPIKRHRYGEMTRNPNQYIPTSRCIHSVVVNRRMPGTFFRSGKIKERTCDSCFVSGKLCARLVKPDGDFGRVKVGIYPVPEGYRKFLTWDQEAFWLYE